MNDGHCLFCKIAAKQIPAKVVREDDATIAFLDIMPRTIGHVVVISKYHTPDILSLPDADRDSLFAAAAAVDKLLVDKLSPDGMTIGFNQGAASGQEVGHLHLHFMPRWHDDGGKAVQSVVSKPPRESLDVILARILG